MGANQEQCFPGGAINLFYDLVAVCNTAIRRELADILFAVFCFAHNAIFAKKNWHIHYFTGAITDRISLIYL